MKLFFAHDSKFFQAEDGTVYSRGNFPYSVWQRYLTFFEQVVVVGRLSKFSSDTGTLSVSSGKNVDFQYVSSLGGPLKRVFNYRKVEQDITKTMRDCDAVIIRLPSEIGLVALKVAKKLEKPYSTEVVGCVWESLWNYGNLQGKFYAPIYTFFTKRAIKNSPRTLYVTQHYLQERYPSIGERFSCSNVEIILDEGIMNKRKKKIHDMNTEVKIGLIGSFTGMSKGIDLAIRSLSIICKNNPKAELHVLGPGDPKELIELAAKYGVKDSVYFHGLLPSGEKVYQWLDQIDIYIQPSRNEGLPRALIEAMSRGCPSVGAITGGIPELLEPAFLHKPNNILELTERILVFMEDKQLMLKEAEVNFSKVTYYRKETNDARRAEFLQSLYNTGKNG
jgi:glycosyltransferase involved in cell wall biosynthesis